MFNKNSTLKYEDFSNAVGSLRKNVIDTNNSITDLLTTSNDLYTKSSVYEDCILNKYLNIYNLVKNIKYNVKLSHIFTDSFISEDYLDKTFPVDKKLNIDTLNGDAILPIISTEDIPVSAIIIENTSNGSIGSSVGSQSYDDINSILSSDSSSLFIYEKVVSILSVDTLKLNLTLKFEKEEICNGLYLQLYVDSNTLYPSIDKVSVSRDGETYNDISLTSIELDQADKYIRFAPQYLRYISISFSQATYDSIQTGFGSRYRYSIGIRQVTPKRTNFDTSGEYVSIPLTVPNNVNSISFNATDISNNDIWYFISANNGSKWMRVSNSINTLDNEKLGLNITDKVESLRVKLLMDKTNIKFGIGKTSEFTVWSKSNKYYLRNIPIDISAYVGNYISYGNKFPYSINIPNTILNSSTLNNSDYIVTLNNIPYSTLIFNQAASGVVDNIVIELNGSQLDPSIYTILPDIYPENCVLKLNTDRLTPGILYMYYKPLTFNGLLGSTLNLPQDIFIQDNGAIFISVLDNNMDTVKILENNEFDITGPRSIKIKDEAYNNKLNYMVLYSPSIQIKESISFNGNEVSIQSLKSLDVYPQIRFDYTYEEVQDTLITKYYTPICKDYRVEFI